MKKKLLMTTIALGAAAALSLGLAACTEEGGEEVSLTDDRVAEIIAGYTSSPTTIDATFTQTYTLDVDSDNASFLSYAQDIDDTVTVQADLTSGDLYYYGKKVDKDGEVTEQLLYKDGDTYYYMTTTTAKTALESESAAAEMIDTLMNSLTRQTSGYIDTGAFVYSSSWIHTYILLGSGTLSGTESSFDYSYELSGESGLSITLNADYIGYYGDAGTFEFGTDETHTGSQITVVTDDDGFVTSFSQTMNNHLDMNITNPAVPLNYEGTRSLTATYGGTITKLTEIDQELTNPVVTFSSTITNGAVAVYNILLDESYAPSSTTEMASGDSIEVGHYIGVRVTPDEGYEVNAVTINGTEITFYMGGYYCYEVTEADYSTTLAITVTVKVEGSESVAYGTIVLGDIADGCTVTTYDFDYSLFSNDFYAAATEGTTVVAGNTHYVAFIVVFPDGTSSDDYTITVNGNSVMSFGGGIYCYFSSVVAGETYTISIVKNS